MRKRLGATLLAGAVMTVLPIAAHAQEQCFTDGPGSAAVVPTPCPESTTPDTPLSSVPEKPTSRSPELAQTGIGVAPLALSGVGVLAAGGTALFVTRRRED